MIKCTFENNSENSLRHTTVAVILKKDGKILLGRRADHLDLEAGKWDTFGGFVDRDETIEEAAEREVLEESGYTLQNLKLLGINCRPDRPNEDRQNVEFLFAAEAVERVQEPDDETSEFQWFAAAELPEADEIAFDHADNLHWYLENPTADLRLIGFSQ